MKILRANMTQLKTTYEELPEEWQVIGGRGLIAKIMNKEVPPDINPLGVGSKLIVAGGPLAGTIAPQLGRVSVGGKSPLTLGIKEANVGGPAAQKLDKLGIRAVIVEGVAQSGKFYCLKISKDGASLLPAAEYRGLKNYELAEHIYSKYQTKPALITIGIGGERQYKSATISFTDMLGDPSRNASRGGLGAVMGAKGLKAIIIDDSGTPPVQLADKTQFSELVKEWIDIIKHDAGCGFFSKLGTPYAVSLVSYHGTMPADNYSSGRSAEFNRLTGEVIRRNVRDRGGKMHGCMPGCIVQCSIIYNDAQGKRLASAYEYEAVAMLGTNLGINDPDAVARLKFICDDLGIDVIEIGSALGVAASAGKMKMGDVESALKLLSEIEQGTELGRILGDGVVSTAKAFKIDRVPAFKGQAIPGHEARAAKGIRVAYATSPMGADHTAGLTYRRPLDKPEDEIATSLRFQVQAATLDTIGYCLNSVPGRRASIYRFFADTLNARYGLKLAEDDIVELGKQALKDEIKFNQGAEFSKHERYPAFLRQEAVAGTNAVFDIEDSKLDKTWEKLDAFKEAPRIWEVRLLPMPPLLCGANVIQRLGERARQLNFKKVLVVSGPVTKKIGHVDLVQKLLEKSGIASISFSEVEPDAPVEQIEKAANMFKANGCDALIGIGGGSSIDTAKATAVRATHTGPMTQFDSLIGGRARIRPPLPPIIAIPTTSGTGSETNQFAAVSDGEKKFVVISDYIIPKLAVIDPTLCTTMPRGVTADSALDALAHCADGYVATNEPYHPYYEALQLYATKLIGRSLRKAYNDGNNVDARMDMCLAAAFGGMSFSKGVGLSHAIGHTLGAKYHMSHGRACGLGLLCSVRVNKKVCAEQYSDLAWALDHSDDLEASLLKLCKDVNMPIRLRDAGIPEQDLADIAFEASLSVDNLASCPVPVDEADILELLKAFY